jgi:hypothetical protein
MRIEITGDIGNTVAIITVDNDGDGGLCWEAITGDRWAEGMKDSVNQIVMGAMQLIDLGTVNAQNNRTTEGTAFP